MSIHHLAPDTTAARERSRSTDGRFGVQPRAEAELDLAPAPVAGLIGCDADQLLDRSRQIEADRQQFLTEIDSTSTDLLEDMKSRAETVDCPRYLATRMWERVRTRGALGITAVGKAGPDRAAGKRLAQALRDDDSFVGKVDHLHWLYHREQVLSAEASEFRTQSLESARAAARESDILTSRAGRKRSASAAAVDRDAVLAQGGTGQIAELSVLAPGPMSEQVRRTAEGTNLYTAWGEGEPLQRVLDIEVDQAPGASSVRYRYADGSARQVGIHHAQGHTLRRAPLRAVVDTGAESGEPVKLLSGVVDTTG